MNNPLSLSAIVLAGGQSSRMGTDKALITINGVPLLRRVCEAASQCAAQVYIVTPRVEQYQTILPNQFHFIPEKFRADAPNPQGPLVGFAQGLAQIQTEWVLLLACDLPQLSAEVLQRWTQELPTVGEVIALLPRTEKGWEPLCGFYKTSCLPRLKTAINRGERSFQRWLAHEPVQEIASNVSFKEKSRQQAMLFNCNTPADLASLNLT